MLWEKYKKPGKKFSFIGITIHILLNKKKKNYTDFIKLTIEKFLRYSSFLVLKRLSRFKKIT